MAESTDEGRTQQGPASGKDFPARYEEDERRAFPLAAAAVGVSVFLLIMLFVNWVC